MDNIIKKKDFIKQTKIELSKALNILYILEDKTGYKDKKLSKAINLLQDIKFLNHK